jgi:phosphomannomutase
MIHAAALAGLTASGCDVIDLGVAMTPTAGVMVDARKADAGMILTASHNPQQWNGLKCLVRRAQAQESPEPAADACAPDAQTAEEIVGRFRANQPGHDAVTWESLGTIALDETGIDTHVESVITALDAVDLAVLAKDRHYRVVVDSVNGSGAPGALALLERLGCSEIVQLHGEPTGIFPHTPEPTRENLVGLAAKTPEHHGVAGFAQDPDADRLAIIDADGTYIGEEYTLVLAAMAILGSMGERARGQTVCVNLSTSRMIDDVAARFGARVIRTPVGEANVVSAMKAHGSILGGEGNGGVIWPRVTYVRDSLGAMGLTLGLLAREDKPLSEIIADMPRYAIEKQKVDLASKDLALPAIEKIAHAYKDAHVDLQDGVRIDWKEDRAWLHVRASNTEPIMRLIAEAPTAEHSRRILDEAARVIAS